MKVQVVTPWYPRPGNVYSGIFVQKQVEAVIQTGAEVTVEVPQIFPAPRGPVPDAVGEALSALAQQDISAAYQQIDEATFIPTPIPTGSGFSGRSPQFVASIERKRTYLPSDVDVTHAHLGVPTGWAVDQLHNGPLVVTEHQTTIGQVLAEKAGLQQYAEIVESASRFFCVSSFLKDTIVDALGPWAADKIEIMPNIVDLSEIHFRERDTFEFSSWIYVGGLVPHKGVRKLLELFHCYRQSVDETATLTIVGTGVMQSWVERFVEVKGLGAAVALVGAQPHNKVGEYLSKSDVLVHLSEIETFGIASIEGVCAGMPVISLRNGGAESTWGHMEAECGLLLDQTDSIETISAAIAKLKSDPGRLDLSYARSVVEEQFSPQAIGQRLISVYESCL